MDIKGVTLGLALIAMMMAMALSGRLRPWSLRGLLLRRCVTLPHALLVMAL